jgi:hypothetical protein
MEEPGAADAIRGGRRERLVLKRERVCPVVVHAVARELDRACLLPDVAIELRLDLRPTSQWSASTRGMNVSIGPTSPFEIASFSCLSARW